MRSRGRKPVQHLLISPQEINTRYFEEKLYLEGNHYIAGVDEVGRGSLAGPVAAASVILPRDCDIKGIDDSKKLTSKKREYLFEKIKEGCVAWSISFIDSRKIDEINILRASLFAMKCSLLQLKVSPSFLLIDGPFPVDISIPQKCLKKGDARSISIAAASILAKVERDRYMAELESTYPDFSFSVHKGYGTSRHLKELERFGPTPIHRLSFSPVAEKA